MAGKQMTALQLRKNALLLESDLNRLRLRAEIGQLRGALDWAANLKSVGRRAGPWALALAPLAGIVAAFGLRRSSGRGGFWLKTLAAAPMLIRLWRAFATLSKESEPVRPAEP